MEEEAGERLRLSPSSNTLTVFEVLVSSQENPSRRTWRWTRGPGGPGVDLEEDLEEFYNYSNNL